MVDGPLENPYTRMLKLRSGIQHSGRVLSLISSSTGVRRVGFYGGSLRNSKGFARRMEEPAVLTGFSTSFTRVWASLLTGVSGSTKLSQGRTRKWALCSLGGTKAL